MRERRGVAPIISRALLLATTLVLRWIRCSECVAQDVWLDADGRWGEGGPCEGARPGR